MSYSIYGDVTSEGIELDNDYMSVQNGGKVIGTVLTNGATLIVEVGGEASNTTVNPQCGMRVSSGGTANITVINGISAEEWQNNGGEYYGGYYNGGYWGGKYYYYGVLYGNVYVFNGGVVNSTTVNYNGRLYLYSDAKATGITVGSNGFLSIASGGTATGIVAAAGALLDLSVAPGTYIQGTYDGAAFEIKDAVVSGRTVTSGASMTVFSGGTAHDISIDKGFFRVNSGGSAVGIRTNVFFTELTGLEEDELSDSGSFIESGAFVSDCVISHAFLTEGSATIFSGMSADTPIVTGGSLVISSGGVATNIVWLPCNGEVSVEDGGIATFDSQYSGVYYRSSESLVNTEIANGVVCSAEEDSPFYLYVMSGGTANNTVVYSDGKLLVNSGGTANDSLLDGGRLNVSSGGIANRTSIGGRWDDDVDYWRPGALHVSNGGVANSSYVTGDALLHISSGGVAYDTTLSGIYGKAYDEEDGGYVMKRQFASMCVSSGGTAANTTVKEGIVFVSRGGVLSNFTVDTTMECSSSVTTVLYYDEEIYSRSFVTPGIHLAAGGKLTGRMTFLNGAKVFASAGAILDFDLTQTTAGADAIVNDLSAIDGPLSYTITIDGTQESGTYRLADGVTLFTDVIAVTNTDGKQLGVLLVGQTFTYGGTDYALSIDDNGLALTVQADRVAPEKPIAVADITTPTNMDVLVTATFSEDSVVRQYSLDGVNWGTYPGGALLGANLTVYFRGIDAAGNISEVEAYQVTNIDRTAPGKPVATADVTTYTTGSVSVSATFDEDSVQKEYSFDGETWHDYSGVILCTNNQTISFRGIDEAGNPSEITVYEVDNIVKEGPDGHENDSIIGDDGELNPAIVDSEGTSIEEGTGSVLLDDSVVYEDDDVTYHNYVGQGDDADVSKIVLEKGACLCFELGTNGAVKFVLFQLVLTGKGPKETYKMKNIQTVSLKPGKNQNSAGKATKLLWLEAGTYYVSMANAKKNGEAYYNVDIADGTGTGEAAKFFVDGDNGDNNWLYDTKTKEWNAKVTESEALVIDGSFLDKETSAVQIDTDPDTVIEHKVGSTTYTNFVGFGDATDIRKVKLTSAAKLSFDVSLSGGTGKFFVYYKDEKGKLATVKDLSTTFKASGTTKKAAVLEAGTYYIAFQSADAKKGDEVYYNVSVNSGSEFYTDGDSTTNDYDSKAKAVSAEVRGKIVDLEAGKPLQLDGVLDADEGLVIDHNGKTNFVGFGDVSDVVRINAAAGDSLSLKVTATDAVSLSIYGLQKNGKLKALKTVKGKSAGSVQLDYTLKAKDGSEFFVGVEATNAKKGSAAWYNMDVVSFSGSSSDALATQDVLSFGQYGTDVLADASAASGLAEFDDKSAWQNLLA